VNDYYQVLGIPRSATAEQIKITFKRLAVRYHPDKNPGDKRAEEIFKEISLAYDVLSDPEKKARHDLVLAYSRTSKSFQSQTTNYPRYNTYQRRPYSPPGKYQYQFGWSYVRNQLLAFGFVFVVAIIVLSVQAAYEYRLRKEKERIDAWRNQRMQMAIMTFENGKIRPAFDTLRYMIEEFPGEFELKDQKNKLLTKVKVAADQQFRRKDFSRAAFLFTVARDYEEPYLLNLDVHFKLAQSYENLEEYEKAAETINYVLARDSENINLNLELANLYTNRLDEPEKALEFFDRARDKIRGLLEAAYGRAYELVINPVKMPDLYYHVYRGRGIANTKLGNHSDAIKDFNWAILFRPGHGEDYFYRAENYFALNDLRRSCRELDKAIEAGFEAAIVTRRQRCR